MDPAREISNIRTLLSENLELRQLFEKEAMALDVECSICLEPFEDPYLIKACQHVFCKACLNELKQACCPLCRADFKKLDGLAPNSLKQQIIKNLLARCTEDLKNAKVAGLKSLSESTKKVELLRSNSEIRRPAIPKPSVGDQPLSTQMRLKYDQMVQSIFSEIAEDQSEPNPQIYTLKTHWDHSQKNKIENLKKAWKASHVNCHTVNDYLYALENIAFGLADILKIQVNSLQLSSNAKGHRVETEIRHGGITIRKGNHGQQTIISGGNVNISEMLKLMKGNFQDLSNPSFSNDPNTHMYINHQEVKRSEANFIIALTQLDVLLVDCFSQRFSKQEFSKAFSALARISSESVEKKNDAIISMCDYCNELLVEENLEELLNLFKEHIQDDRCVPILGQIYENLISLKASNQEAIQVVMMSLDELSIIFLKNAIVNAIEKGEFAESAFQLLYICEDYRKWCIEQVYVAIKSLTEKEQTDKVRKLVDKYLIKNPETYEGAMEILRIIVKKDINKNNFETAAEIIQKYFLGQPSTHQEGLTYLREMIRYNIKENYNTTACNLIDKYLLTSPGTAAEGLNFIRNMIRYNIKKNYNTTASSLIDKYFLSAPKTAEEGLNYIREMIRYNIKENYNTSACSLIDKYLLPTPKTAEEGLNYIREMIRYNIQENYNTTACSLIDKYLMARFDTKAEALGYIQEMIRYNENKGYHQTVANLKSKYRL